MSRLRFLLLAVAGTGAALAHTGEPFEPHDLIWAWSWEPGVLLSLAIPAVLWGLGARKSRGVTSVRMASFWTGWATLLLGLVSPLHALGETLFTAHMLQHELLMLVAAPLLVLARPLVPLLWGLPFEWRRAIGRWSKSASVQSVWRVITEPLSAWWIHAAALWAWHIPFLFDATVRNDWVHAAQHVSFFASAVLFWWSLFYARGAGSFGAGVLYVFTTGVHTSILGALLTFSPVVWYRSYAATAPVWGWTALEDQQIGGLIMWVPAGLVYTVAGLVLFGLWMRESELRTQMRERGMEAKLPAWIGCGAILLAGVCATSCGNEQANAIAALTGGDPNRGSAAIYRYGCGSCHTIGGISNAKGLVGPPLTGLRARSYLAGRLENTPVNLEAWIRHPKQFDEKTAMPELGVTERDATDIAAYLYSIR